MTEQTQACWARCHHVGVLHLHDGLHLGIHRRPVSVFVTTTPRMSRNSPSNVQQTPSCSDRQVATVLCQECELGGPGCHCVWMAHRHDHRSHRTSRHLCHLEPSTYQRDIHNVERRVLVSENTTTHVVLVGPARLQGSGSGLLLSIALLFRTRYRITRMLYMAGPSSQTE